MQISFFLLVFPVQSSEKQVKQQHDTRGFTIYAIEDDPLV